MFSRILKKASLTPSVRYSFASTQGGNLYTWGRKGSGLATPFTQSENLIPHISDAFHNNVAKVAMGATHTAVVTTDGDVYTFGYNQNGSLGHNEKSKHQFSPKLVEYFRENNIRVKDIAVGDAHTVAVTENGQVYSWGFGGKSLNPLVNLFNKSYGALGLGDHTDHLEPALVEELHPGSKSQVTSGFNFVALLNEKNEVLHWGRGAEGALATESHADIVTPTLNEALHHVCEEEGSKVTKVKACANHILALLENGSLYGWGNNALGQLGIKKDVGVDFIYDAIEHPTKLNDQNIKGKKVVDFDSGEEISVILTEGGEVYWFGLKLALDPEHIQIPEGVKIKKVSVANPYIVLVAENNDVYTTDAVVADSTYNPHVGLYKLNSSAFQGGQVLELGGQYTNRFAIVKN